MPSSDSNISPVTILSSATPDVDGAWVEIIASLSIESKWMMVYVSAGNAGQENALFDIAEGVIASEVEIISDQFYAILNQSGGEGHGTFYSFPMELALGTRLSMRIKDPAANADDYFVAIWVTDQVPSVNVPNVAQSSGAKTVTSGGTDTYGAWEELIPSLNRNSVWFCLSGFSFGDTGSGLFDLAIGPAGVEVPVIEKIHYYKLNFGVSNGRFNTVGYSFPMVVPVGSRLAIRARDEEAAMNDYIVGLTVF
jgi:hypothetical protein